MSHPCRRVLVVEDDDDVRASICEFLALEGIEPVAVAGGEEALAALARPPPPDAILLDLGMPGMGGSELLERIRRQERWADIPVAVMTGFARNRFQYLAGADDYIEKPFDLERLNEAISRLCRRARERRAAD